MIIRYTYPVNTALSLDEKWPICVDGFSIDWVTSDNNRVTHISVEVEIDKLDALPTIRQSEKKGVALDINIKELPKLNEVEEALRTLQGILSIFAILEIKFEELQVEWIGQTTEENEKIQIHSFQASREKPELNSPRELNFDLIARAVASISEASDYEVPLSFLRKAQLDMHSDRYIEAFYSFFFFLETQFAPGYSDPKVVKNKLKSSSLVRDGLLEAKSSLLTSRRPDDAAKLPGLLALSDEKLIEALVKLRGNLHHHAHSKPGIWHPDKQKEYRSEALLIGEICHAIALHKSLNIMFNPDRDNEIQDSAERAGAKVALLFDAKDSHGNSLQQLKINMIGKKVRRAHIVTADKEFRRLAKSLYAGVDVASYEILSEDGETVYARYDQG